MIQVTGLYPGQTGIIYDNPQLHIEFHGVSMGGLSVDVRVIDPQFQCIGYLFFTVKRDDLIYDPQIQDPYDSLVYSIQNCLISQMTSNNPYNATFQIINS